MFFRILCTIVPVLVASASLVAQTPQNPPPDPRRAAAAAGTATSELARGWTLLASGRAGDASTVAAALMRSAPGSSAALELGVHAEIAARGSVAALSVYETWLTGRRWEPVYVLREIAAARLREIAASTDGTSVMAIDALLAAGDSFGLAEAERRAAQGSPAAARSAAASGDPRAVAALVQQVNTTAGSARTAAIEALGRVKGTAAIAPLTTLLADPEPLNRAAAAKALVQVQGPAAAAAVGRLLQDSSSFVRLEAAGALYRIGDTRGQAILQQLEASAAPAMRLSAAGLMARPQPDASWLSLVRSLLQDSDPLVRLNAAKLIAPHDPAAARAVLDVLANDTNVALREEASRLLPAALSDDVAGLRRLLRHADLTTVIQAAARLLALTGSAG